jgi:hypothetical protein
MSALVVPALRPEAIKLPGNHSSTPKLTNPHASAASVSATPSPSRGRTLDHNLEGWFPAIRNRIRETLIARGELLQYFKKTRECILSLPVADASVMPRIGVPA